MALATRAVSILRTLAFHPSVHYLNSTVAGGLAIQVCTFVSGIILARALGPNGRGIVAAAMLWPPLLASLAGLGIAEALVVRTARSDASVARSLSAAMLVGACQSLVAAACGWIVLPKVLGSMPPEVITIGRYYLLVIPLTYAWGFVAMVLQARQYRFNVFRASYYVAYAIVLLVLWLLHAVNPRTVIAAALGMYFVPLLLGARLLLRKGWLHPQLALSEARQLVGFGYRVYVGIVASILAGRLDFVILAALVSAAELGNYAVAGIPGSILTLLPISASLVAYPAVVRMPREAVPATIARCLALATLTILLAFLVDLTLPVAMPLALGPGYQRAVPIAQILTFGITIRSATGLLGAVVRGLARPLLSGFGDVVGLPIFGVLLALMVPNWQGVGAAIALTIAALIGFAAMMVVSMHAARMTVADVGPLWRRDAVRLGRVIRQARTASAHE
jgi:O-antigen/teichoic acid export membrane protein